MISSVPLVNVLLQTFNRLVLCTHDGIKVTLLGMPLKVHYEVLGKKL